MPEITAETPRSVLTIAGRQLPVPQPFEEGHPCTGPEAAALNQVFAENLRNNFAARLKASEADLKPGEKLDEDKVRADFEEYATSYQFGVRKTGGGGTVVSDPVRREALSIAKEAVRQALKSAGHSIRDVGGERIAELAAQLIEQQPAFMEEAKRRVEQAAQIGIGSLTLPTVEPRAAETGGEAAAA